MTAAQANAVELARTALKQQNDWWNDHFGDRHPSDHGLHKITIDIWAERWNNTRKALTALERAFEPETKPVPRSTT